MRAVLTASSFQFLCGGHFKLFSHFALYIWCVSLHDGSVDFPCCVLTVSDRASKTPKADLGSGFHSF